MTAREKCRHRYPLAVEPWDPSKVRCRGCGSPAPTRIMKAVYNTTLDRRIRRRIRAQWAEVENQ